MGGHAGCWGQDAVVGAPLLRLLHGLVLRLHTAIKPQLHSEMRLWGLGGVLGFRILDNFIGGITGAHRSH